MNGHSGLVVVCGGEHLRLFSRHSGVLFNQRCGHATHGFNTQRQRGHVQEQYVFYVTAQHRTLDCCTRSEEHTSELQSRGHLVCRLLLEKKNNITASHSREKSAAC